MSETLSNQSPAELEGHGLSYEGFISSHTDELFQLTHQMRHRDLENPGHARRLTMETEAGYNPLLTKIYETEYPELEPHHIPAIIAADVTAMNELRLAASHGFDFDDESYAKPSWQRSFYKDYIYGLIDGRARSINPPPLEIESTLQKGMSQPMRLVAASITPLRLSPELIATDMKRQELFDNMADFLQLSKTEQRFAHEQSLTLLERRYWYVENYLKHLHEQG